MAKSIGLRQLRANVTVRSSRVVLNTIQLSESADFLGRQQKMISPDVTQALELRTQLRMCT